MTGELGVRIVTEIAEREGVDPTTLTPPLHEVIDPDALDGLFASTPSNQRNDQASVSFTYKGYRVTVTGEGDVTVTGAPETAPSVDATQETAID